MRILLTNDDGVYAPGIAALKAAVAPLGDVTVVAPDSERSATAHSITLDRPLRMREVYVADELLGYAVDGSPADCVKIGVQEILPEPPDLVLSGINLGVNVGINVLYSGTVAAALEGAILNSRSVAVSLAASRKPDFTAAAHLALPIIMQILDRAPRPGSIFNINIPALGREEISGVAVAPQCTVSYDDSFDVRVDPRGGTYYWMTGEMQMDNLPEDSDMAMLESGYITVTPLQYDLTNKAALEEARTWDFDLPDTPR